MSCVSGRRGEGGEAVCAPEGGPFLGLVLPSRKPWYLPRHHIYFITYMVRIGFYYHILAFKE